MSSGADPGFSWGGGAQKITSAESNSLSAGVQGLIKGPGSSRVVVMLSRAIWALFLSILIFFFFFFYKWIKNTVDPILGGPCCAPSLGSATRALNTELPSKHSTEVGPTWLLMRLLQGDCVEEVFHIFTTFFNLLSKQLQGVKICLKKLKWYHCGAGYNN